MTAVDNSPQESASVIRGPTGSREWDRSSYVVPTGDSIIIIIIIRFTADTLHHVVNLTFDGKPMPLNVCSVSIVMWSKSVLNLSENNPRPSYSDLKAESLEAVSHLKFNQKLIFKSYRHPKARSALAYHISIQSSKAKRSYWWFNKFYRPFFILSNFVAPVIRVVWSDRGYIKFWM